MSQQMVNLKTYVKHNITEPESSPFYNENLCHVIEGYFGSKGEFLDEDIEFLHENGFHEDEFIDEDYESYEDYMNH